MIQTFSQEGLFQFTRPNIEKLRAACFSVILAREAAGYDDVRAEFRVCFWKKLLITTRFIVTAVERKTNKRVKLYRGTNPIKDYTLAKWRFDHAQAKEIQWNVITFSCDGHRVDVDTSYEDSVRKAAEADAQAGAIDRTVRGVGQFLHRLTIGGHTYSSTY